MLKRTVTAVCAIALFVPICYFSHTAVFPAAMALLALAAAYEMLGCTANRGKLTLALPAYIVSASLPLIPFFAKDGEAVPILASVCVIYLISVFAAVVFSRGAIAFPDAASSFMGIIYVAVTFSCIVLLRQTGKYTYLLVFIGPWVSDTFAYFCGRLFGKHKLIPEISPKKTVEGSIGGIVFAAISFVVYAVIIKTFFNTSAEPNYAVLAVSGAVVSVISQIGDLSASAVKRYYGIKDYGFIFPGHGGVLDRFDSVILTSPVLYIIASIPALSGMFI